MKAAAQGASKRWEQAALAVNSSDPDDVTAAVMAEGLQVPQQVLSEQQAQQAEQAQQVSTDQLAQQAQQASKDQQAPSEHKARQVSSDQQAQQAQQVLNHQQLLVGPSQTAAAMRTHAAEAPQQATSNGRHHPNATPHPTVDILAVADTFNQHGDKVTSSADVNTETATWRVSRGASEVSLSRPKNVC